MIKSQVFLNMNPNYIVQNPPLEEKMELSGLADRCDDVDPGGVHLLVEDREVFDGL